MEYLINRISFTLPAKAFSIDYAISQKRQLPVVKEFLVRLIYALGECDPSTIKSFFGLSDTELMSSISDLEEERLTEWRDGQITLSAYAKEKFESENGRMVPRFFEIEDVMDTVSFDLHSFRLLYSSIKSTNRNSLGVDIALPNDAYNFPNERARSAFDSNFMLFREKVKGTDIFSDKAELYKINHVSEKYDLIIPIEVSYLIDSTDTQQMVTRYENAAIEEWDSTMSLFSSMDEAIVDGSKTFDEERQFLEYLRASYDPYLTDYWADGKLNTHLLIEKYEAGIFGGNRETQVIVGNLYTPENSCAMMGMIREKYGEKLPDSGAIWFSNHPNSTWGRTAALTETVSDINTMFDRRKSIAEVLIVMECMSKGEAFQMASIFHDTDAKLIDCQERFGGEYAEIFLIPNIFVCCLYHKPLTDNRALTFPIGYVSTDQVQVGKVARAAKLWSEKTGQFRNYFEKNEAKECDYVLNKTLRLILADIQQQ